MAAALVQKKEDGNAASDAANHANLSGNKTLLTNYNGAAVMRQSSNRWEGNKESSGPTKTAGSERGPNEAAALVQKKEDGNTASDTANGANLSGKPYLVNAYNSPAVVRQSSNKWEGNAEYTTNTKTAGSERGPNPTVPAALAQTKINPNGPTGLVPQKVDQ